MSQEASSDDLTAICALCGAERPMSTMMIEHIAGGMVFVCGGVDPATGEDTISDCEQRRGV